MAKKPPPIPGWHPGIQPTGTQETKTERRLEAFELRKKGYSYRAIGRALGVSEFTAHKDVMGRMREINDLEAVVREDVRRLEVERLDALLAAHWDKAMAGDVGSTRTALSIMERRAGLLGLDAPKATEPATDVTQLLTILQSHGNGNGGRRVYDA